MATKLLEDNVGCRCSVCYQTYGDERIERVPRILTCGHTYCTGEAPIEAKGMRLIISL